MVVNESALLRAMREDYKGQGYTVARRAENEADPESESILLLSANDWMVEIGWKNVSAKIFGLVAEHMKGLPEVGQAFKVKKTKQNAVYQEIEIYTVGTDQKSRQREKQKVTPVPFRGKNPEHWDGHNAKRARKWFIRLLNTNFTEADTHTSLTYSDEFLPKTEEEADRDISNFLRRLRTKCKARGLPAPEAITVTEHQDADPDTGQKAVRFHHHVILKCQLTRDEIEGCWVRKKKRMD